MSIEYIKGDLFETDCKYMAHGVNCQGIMGSGVAKIVRDRFPVNYYWYTHYAQKRLSAITDSSKLLGDVLCHNEHGAPELENGKQWFHLFTQDVYGYDGHRFVNYEAVYKCFQTLTLIKRMSVMFPDFNELAIPKIGAGLGGGDWDIISTIIKKTVCESGLRVKVYEL